MSAVVTFKDEEGNKIPWLGYSEADPAKRIGLDEAIVYMNKNAEEIGKKTLDSDVDNMNVAKSVLTTSENVTDTYRWYWATFHWAEGIFGEDELTITTSMREISEEALTNMSIYESPTTHTTTVVEFANLKTDGTVYVV